MFGSRVDFRGEPFLGVSAGKSVSAETIIHNKSVSGLNSETMKSSYVGKKRFCIFLELQ